MKLNHLNLPVPDVAHTSAFFEKYFYFTCIEVKGDNALAILKGQDDFTLVLMGPSFYRNSNATYPDALHIGFLMQEPAQVEQLYNRLTADGMLLTQQPRNMRGVYGFYFYAPGSILTEISCPI
jgi:catechol 2,3-dioxygenase-like lactoylglutathione lyase family enzyme